MTIENTCTNCPVQDGYKPAEAVHQIAEPLRLLGMAGVELVSIAQLDSLNEHQATRIAAPTAQAVEPCRICFETEPHSGTCGSSDPQALCNAALRATPPAPAAVAVPAGWKLVPCEPQDMQQAAGAQAIRFDTTLINKMWTANKVYREMVASAPECAALAAPQAQDVQRDAIRALIAKHSAELEHNHYAYFELAYTRQTGWMAWITDHPRSMPHQETIKPDRKVLASGQGDTAEAACAAAIAASAKGGA